MISKTLIKLFTRDLNKLKTEISAYKSEKALWHIEKDIANSGGNLALHLVGNLKTYIGANMGNNNYIRKRDLEFSLKNVPRTEILKQIDETIFDIELTLKTITDEELKEEYPFLIFKEKTSIAYLLFHLSTHLTYHLGQVNYHRRLLDG